MKHKQSTQAVCLTKIEDANAFETRISLRSSPKVQKVDENIDCTVTEVKDRHRGPSRGNQRSRTKNINMLEFVLGQIANH